VELWHGERDASKYGNIAVQINLVTQEIVGDENCLYLNVYTTKIKSSEKRTVMVWIHDGYFVGSGNPDWYGLDPLHCMQTDIVLVTMNFRLNSLGMLFITLIYIFCISFVFFHISSENVNVHLDLYFFILNNSLIYNYVINL